MSTRKESFSGSDGGSEYRGEAYARIDLFGNVEYRVVRAARRDAPALLMASLGICARLTEIIDDADG